MKISLLATLSESVDHEKLI